MIVLKMIGWLFKIIGVLLLILLTVLLVALCFPVHLEIKYLPDVTFRVKYLFIRYTVVGEEEEKKPPGRMRRFLTAVLGAIIWLAGEIARFFRWLADRVKALFAWVKKKLFRPKPKKKKRPKADREDEPEEKNQSLFSALREQRGFFGALKFFVDIGKALGGGLVRIYRGVTVDRFLLRVRVSGEDAADTAVKYGAVCSGAFPALSYLLGNTRRFEMRRHLPDIEITPDFAGEGIRIVFDGALTVFPILVLGNLLWALLKFAAAQLKITFKNKQQEKGLKN